MRLSFVFPELLWLLLLLLPLWALALATPRRLTLPRFWASLLLRAALIATLVLALAGARIVRDVDAVTTVFLVDRSDSIAPEARDRATAFVQESLKAMRPGDRAAVVVFGANALVERAPSGEPAIGPLNAAPVASGTNIQEAVQLGLQLLPAETNKRLVVLSDGGENAGDTRAAANQAAARGVPISYVDLSTPGASEALLVGLAAPASARAGQQFELVATVESSVAQTARLRILGDDRPLFDQNVSLRAGPNRFSVTVGAQDQGFRRYHAEIVPQTDSRGENNAAEALVRVAGEPRVLLVEGRSGEGQVLKAALAAARVNAEVVAPEALPGDPAALGAYDAVVLINVPAAALSPAAQAILPVYVRELGKGLIMIGGDRSYGVGGYSQTPVEEALPVYMDIRDRRERPNLAIMFVLDKSSSMQACHCSGPSRETDGYYDHEGRTKLEIGKDGVLRSVAVLDPRDTAGVVAFEGTAFWAFPPQQGPQPDVVQSAISPLLPDGHLTNIGIGLEMAEEALKRTDARVKHVILLTDGWSRGSDPIAIAQRMYKEGITTSVVAEGLGAAPYLQQLADAGGGRLISVQNMEEAPQVFVQETIRTARNYLVEQPFTPRYAVASPILDGLDRGLPRLYGYNGTTVKETATTVLAGVDDAPVLAQWQYGLGRAVAWTSDVKGQWAKDWVRWPEFPRFAAQLVGWTLPSGAEGALAAELRAEGTQTVIGVTAQDARGQPRTGLELRATIVGAGGFTQEVALTQVAPGKYRGAVASPPQGSYLVRIAGAQDGRAVQETAGLVVPYSPEYRLGQSNPALLEALARTSGGAGLAQPAEAFAHDLRGAGSAQEIGLPLVLLALLLLPIDIAVRRLPASRRAAGQSRAHRR